MNAGRRGGNFSGPGFPNPRGFMGVGGPPHPGMRMMMMMRGNFSSGGRGVFMGGRGGLGMAGPGGRGGGLPVGSECFDYNHGMESEPPAPSPQRFNGANMMNPPGPPWMQGTSRGSPNEGMMGGPNQMNQQGPFDDDSSSVPVSPMITPPDVIRWLEGQDPGTVRGVMLHCRWILEQMGCPVPDPAPTQPCNTNHPEEMDSWYEGDSSPALMGLGPGNTDLYLRGGMARGARGRAGFKRPLPGGVGSQVPNKTMRTGGNLGSALNQVTTTMKPLPEPEIIPPTGVSGAASFYPEAAADRGKLKMLSNNVSMMTVELNKICRLHKIQTLDRNDLTKYTEEAQPRLRTALQCVMAAEKTLAEFKAYLKDEKYKVWNEEQKKKYEEALKNFIGETPKGTPHKKPTQSQTAETKGSGAANGNGGDSAVAQE